MLEYVLGNYQIKRFVIECLVLQVFASIISTGMKRAERSALVKMASDVSGTVVPDFQARSPVCRRGFVNFKGSPFWKQQIQNIQHASLSWNRETPLAKEMIPQPVIL